MPEPGEYKPVSEKSGRFCTEPSNPQSVSGKCPITSGQVRVQLLGGVVAALAGRQDHVVQVEGREDAHVSGEVLRKAGF